MRELSTEDALLGYVSFIENTSTDDSFPEMVIFILLQYALAVLMLVAHDTLIGLSNSFTVSTG